ncbi:MAG: hypothetical protein ACFE9L_00145 [Candidatus Hodarchaeota archaeon]
MDLNERLIDYDEPAKTMMVQVVKFQELAKLFPILLKEGITLEVQRGFPDNLVVKMAEKILFTTRLYLSRCLDVSSSVGFIYCLPIQTPEEALDYVNSHSPYQWELPCQETWQQCQQAFPELRQLPPETQNGCPCPNRPQYWHWLVVEPEDFQTHNPQHQQGEINALKAQKINEEGEKT